MGDCKKGSFMLGRMGGRKTNNFDDFANREYLMEPRMIASKERN